MGHKNVQIFLVLLLCLMVLPVSANSLSSAEELYKQAQNFVYKGELERAITSYTLAINQDKNYSQAYSGRALVYSMLQKHDLALIDNSKCIELDPTNFGYYLNRGHNYIGLEEYQSAIADYSKSIELKDAFFGRKARAGAYITTKQYNLAMIDINRMEQIWPRDADVFIYKSQVYGLLGDYSNAVEKSKQGLSLYPENAIILFVLGQCYEFSGNKELAFEYYTKALNKDLAGRYYKKTVMIKNKISARLQGDWDSYSEWIYF